MQRPDYEFEKYLDGDHPISQQFQKEQTAQPSMPADLEQSILSMAHKSARRRSPQWRWLAIAASFVLVSVIYRGSEWAIVDSLTPSETMPLSFDEVAQLKPVPQNTGGGPGEVTLAKRSMRSQQAIVAESEIAMPIVPDSKAKFHAQLRPSGDTDLSYLVAAAPAAVGEYQSGLNKQCLLSQFDRFTEQQLALEQWSRHWLQMRYPQLAQLAVARQEQRSWKLQFEQQLVRQVGRDAPQALPAALPFADWAASFDTDTLEAACQSNGALCASLASWQYQLAQQPETLAEGFSDLFRSTEYQSKLQAIPAHVEGCQ
ncbi:hypothetical protein [Corallincola spongiicola]|uniref:DUF3106 domain-containing protein n=1 Tax=Corallincola spongiicola TaxID=2520508 RepID=A0ABY1WTZ8_9GAMM|nr:hypothetical protein [Corallincola spongiicola]TAA48061.1 hypothetical protein EXY25_02125 [Corallincola spongiicola]